MNIENENYEEVSSKYKWKFERLDSFINAINENVFVDKINILTNFTNTCASGDDVNDSLTQFSVLMQTVTEDLLKLPFIIMMIFLSKRNLVIIRGLQTNVVNIETGFYHS